MTKTIEIIAVKSWAAFEGELQALGTRRQTLQDGAGRRFDELLYRGLGNSNWGLETTLERSYPMERSRDSGRLLDYYGEIYASKHGIGTFTKQDWPSLPNPSELRKTLKGSDTWIRGLPPDEDAPGLYEYMIYLRHHGYPSPFLDWSASPYVAAFFAFDTMDRSATDVCVYVLLKDTMRAFASGQANVSIIGPYARSHARHFNQQSRYSICLEVEDGEYMFAKQEPTMLKDGAGVEGQLYKLTIPATERVAALRNLDLMNINPFSLYGSDDSLVRTVARRECLIRR